MKIASAVIGAVLLIGLAVFVASRGGSHAPKELSKVRSRLVAAGFDCEHPGPGTTDVFGGEESIETFSCTRDDVELFVVRYADEDTRERADGLISRSVCSVRLDDWKHAAANAWTIAADDNVDGVSAEAAGEAVKDAADATGATVRTAMC